MLPKCNSLPNALFSPFDFMLRRFIQKQGRYEKYVVSDLKIGYVMYIDIANKILVFLEGTFFKYVSTKLTKAEIMK